MQRRAGVNPWIAIAGARDQGRLEVTERLRAALVQSGTRVTGFVQQPTVDTDQQLIGYDVVDLDTGDRCPLARESATPEMCRWGFENAAFLAARRWALRPADVTVLEVGRLEAAERGHWPTILSALREPGRLVVLGMRPNVVASVAVRLPDPVELVELPASARELDGFVDRVLRLAAGVL